MNTRVSPPWYKVHPQQIGRRELDICERASLSWRYGFSKDCDSRRRRRVEEEETEEEEESEEVQEEGGRVLHNPAVNGKLDSECQAKR